jgi:dienelactone hydrolase
MWHLEISMHCLSAWAADRCCLHVDTGKAFRRGDRHDWGGQDYNDVFSGAVHLIKTGVADPHKVAHVGWSYGGCVAGRYIHALCSLYIPVCFG